MPHKVWQVGEEVIAPDFNTYVQQQVVEQFPNVAARTAAVTAPVAGQPSYIDSGDMNEGPEFYNGTSWRRPWNMPWGRIGNGAAVDQATVGSNLYVGLGTTPALPMLVNRAYAAKIELGGGFGSTPGDSFNIYFGELGQANISGGVVAIMLANAYLPPGTIMAPFSSTAGNKQFDMRVQRVAGTGTLQFRARLFIYDEGPAGAPT